MFDYVFKMKFREMIKKFKAEAYSNAERKGFHDLTITHGEYIALIHSELSEGLQALRDENPPDKHCPKYSSLEIELADAVIRIMDYAADRKLDIAGAIIDKMEYNTTRPYKHGKKF